MTYSTLTRLDGRVAVVTGASSGLGAACAVSLAEAGADVAVAARRVEGLERCARAVREAGARACVVPLDVTDPTACDQAVATILETFGRLDAVVCNAGVGGSTPALRETPEEWRRVLSVNLDGCYWTAKAAAREMSHGGSITFVSSVLAMTTAGMPQAAYSASKSALIGLTHDLAQQWTRRRGIRVNAVCPGFFPSEMTDECPPGFLDDLAERRILSGRLGAPQELAAVVTFLASDAAGYITGAEVLVDGGMAIT